MRGRANFSIDEIHRIEHALSQMGRCDARRKRSLQGRLRRQHRFFVSDFAGRGRRLTAEDVERLIAQGVIRVKS